MKVHLTATQCRPGILTALCLAPDCPFDPLEHGMPAFQDFPQPCCSGQSGRVLPASFAVLPLGAHDEGQCRVHRHVRGRVSQRGRRTSSGWYAMVPMVLVEMCVALVSSTRDSPKSASCTHQPGC